MWGRRFRRILIVAASESVPGLTPAFLAQPDIRLVESRPDPGVLAVAREQSPRLIIQDVDEPVPDSLRLAHTLKSDPSTTSIPLIAVAERGALDQVRLAGANAVVAKPLIQHEYWDAVRRFIRLPKRRDLRQLVNLRFTYQADGHTGQAFSRDLSMLGAFLKTDRAFQQGKHISVSLYLPGQREPICCGAIVRRSTPYDPHGHQVAGFGIEFEGLNGRDVLRLERFIKRHLRRTLFGLITG